MQRPGNLDDIWKERLRESKGKKYTGPALLPAGTRDLLIPDMGCLKEVVNGESGLATVCANLNA